MGVLSNVVSFVTNEEIEPTAGVHKLLLVLFFSDPSIVLRSIKDAVDSWKKRKDLYNCFFLFRLEIICTWVVCSLTETVVEVFLFRIQLEQLANKWKFNHFPTMNKTSKIVNTDTSKMIVNSLSVTCACIILLTGFLVNYL